MRIIEELSHKGISENIKKVSDIPDDYSQKMKPIEWVIVVLGTALGILGILALLGLI